VGEVTLRFGNTLVDVTVLSDSELIATTPAVPVEASVDVTVTSDLGEAVLTNGYAFLENVPDDGGSGGDSGAGGDAGSGDDSGSGSGSDGGSGTDNSGLVTGYAEHNYYVVGCPSCLGFADYVSLESIALFHPPATGSWYDWFPRQGTCEVNPGRSYPTSTFTDVGTTALLSAGSSTRSLSRVRDGSMTYYSANTIDDGSFVRNTSYDLLAPYATPALSAPGVLRTISTGFTNIQPESLFYDDLYAFQTMSASSAVFSWAPAGTADGVVVNIHIFDSTGSSYRGEVFCWVSDSGYFQVPFNDIATLAYSGDLAMIYYAKTTLSEGINPDDGSTIEASSAFGGIGTATIIP
jgi:hypothetical protein